MYICYLLYIFPLRLSAASISELNVFIIHYLRQGGYVYPEFVCLSVWSDLYQNFSREVQLRENWLNFRSYPPPYPDIGLFWR